MPRPKGRKTAVRLSVSLEESSHAALLRLADRHGVSMAWMIRKAVSDFVATQEQTDQAELPLLRSSEGQ